MHEAMDDENDVKRLHSHNTDLPSLNLGFGFSASREEMSCSSHATVQNDRFPII
jgi:hypothetical protein